MQSKGYAQATLRRHLPRLREKARVHPIQLSTTLRRREHPMPILQHESRTSSIPRPATHAQRSSGKVRARRALAKTLIPLMQTDQRFTNVQTPRCDRHPFGSIYFDTGNGHARLTITVSQETARGILKSSCARRAAPEKVSTSAGSAPNRRGTSNAPSPYESELLLLLKASFCAVDGPGREPRGFNHVRTLQSGRGAPRKAPRFLIEPRHWPCRSRWFLRFSRNCAARLAPHPVSGLKLSSAASASLKWAAAVLRSRARSAVIESL